MIVIIHASKQPTFSPVVDAMQGDSNTMVIRFLVPAMADGIDLTGLKWQVDVYNSAGESESVPPDVLIEDGNIRCDWHVGGIATKEDGITTFQLSGATGSSVWQSHPSYLNVHKSKRIAPAYTPAICGAGVCGEIVCGKE